jgi:stage II sporulation protein AB (anti-sigma F factor)
MKKRVVNSMKLTLPAISENERMARGLVSSMVATLNPTVGELGDIRCALSEAVTNAIVHGYSTPVAPGEELIYIAVTLYADRTIKLTIRDHGRGIPDVEAAREPLFTTDDSGDRSGMGFSVMEAFCDRVEVSSKVGQGTKVSLFKTLS